MTKQGKSAAPEGSAALGGAGHRQVKKATNLTLEPQTVARADRFARRQGLSLSQLVTDLLRALPDDESPVDVAVLTPQVRRLYGVAGGGAPDRESYREYLVRKYGRPG